MGDGTLDLCLLDGLTAKAEAGERVWGVHRGEDQFVWLIDDRLNESKTKGGNSPAASASSVSNKGGLKYRSHLNLSSRPATFVERSSPPKPPVTEKASRSMREMRHVT